MARAAAAADPLVGIQHVLPMHRRRTDQHDHHDHADDDDPTRKTTNDHHPTLRCGHIGGAGDLDSNITADIIAARAPRPPL
jgi:hypothetical protein